MKKHLVLVLTEPTEGRDDEYHDYYENLHLDEVIKVTKLETAQRFKLIDQVGEPCPLPYLAAYEVQAEEGTDIIANMNDTRHLRQQSKSLNKKTGRMWVFEEIGPRHE